MAVLDSLENHFNIDTESIYFAGFSMGGFMCNRMAIEHGDRITAIASVSGTIGNEAIGTPIANINTLHIHGNADTQVGYENAEYTIMEGYVYSLGYGAEACVEFWKTHNACDETAIVNIFPDTEADGLTFERSVYLNGDNDSYTAFIKVIGGDHYWYYTPQNDIDYTTEIYKFFTNTMDFSVGFGNEITESSIEVYPNPAKNYVHIAIGNEEQALLNVYDILGSVVTTQRIKDDNVIDISNIPEGMYIFRIFNGTETIDKKVMINR